MEDRLHVDVSTPPLRATPPAADGLHGFAAASPDLACITDTAGTVTSVNAAWRDVLGWTRREIVGRSILELVHPDDVASTRSHLQEVLDGRTVRDRSSRWPHADGGWRRISWSSRLGSDGRLMYASGRDVTDHLEQDARSSQAATELERVLATERAEGDGLRDLDRRKDTYRPCPTNSRVD